MKYYIALENKKTPQNVHKDNSDIETSKIELELTLVTTTDDQDLPVGKFEVMRMCDEIPEEWDKYFPEILPGKPKGAIKRTGVYFGFSGKQDERNLVIDYVEEMMEDKGSNKSGRITLKK